MIGPIPPVAVDARLRQTATISGGQEIEIAIIVTITPGYTAQGKAGQCDTFGDKVTAIVTVEGGQPSQRSVRGPPIVEQVEITIIVIIAPGDCPPPGPRQPGVDRRKNRRAQQRAIIAVDQHRAITINIASQRQIEIAIIVVITPGQGTLAHGGEAHRLRGEGWGVSIYHTLVTVKIGGGTSPWITGQQQIEVTVAVIVTPRRRALIEPRQAGSNVGKMTGVVAVEQGAQATGGLSAHQQVEIAVVVKITPGHRAIRDTEQADGRVKGEPPGLIDIKLGIMVTGTAPPADNQVEIAITIIVAPIGSGKEPLWQRGIDAAEAHYTTSRHTCAIGVGAEVPL